MKTKLFLIVMMIIATTCGIKAQNDSIALTTGPQIDSNSEDHPGGWDFSLPFMNSSREKEHANNYKLLENGRDRAPYPHCTSFQFGFISGVDEAPGVNIDMGQSFELELRNLVAFSSRLSSHSFFSLGFGLSWRNYRMTGNTRFDKDGSGRIVTTGYPEGASPKFSRFKVLSIAIPLEYRYKITSRFGFGFGPVFNWNVYGSMKTKYKLDGGTHKYTDKTIHQRVLTIDWLLRVYNPVINFYVKYSPMNVLKSDWGPQFQSVSFGIEI